MKYTSIEQSKKLLEAGIDPMSADLYWHSNLDNSDREYLLGMGEEEYWDIEMMDSYNDVGKYDYPAWSVEVLLKLIGSCGLNFSPFSSDFVSIVSLDREFNETSLIDACYEAVLYQLEEGYIKKSDSIS